MMFFESKDDVSIYSMRTKGAHLLSQAMKNKKFEYFLLEFESKDL